MKTGQSPASGVVGETAFGRRLRVLREVVEAERALAAAQARLAAARAEAGEIERMEAAETADVPSEPEPFFGSLVFGPTQQSQPVAVPGVSSDYTDDVVGYLRAFSVDGGAGWKWSALFHVFGEECGRNLYDCTWAEGVRWLRAQHARFLSERSVSTVALAA